MTAGKLASGGQKHHFIPKLKKKNYSFLKNTKTHPKHN